MENEQKMNISAEVERVDISSDIATSKEIESMQEGSARCDEIGESKAEMVKVQEKNMISDEKDAACDQTLKKSNSKLEMNVIADDVERIFEREKDNNDIQSSVMQKTDAPSDASCEPDQCSPVLLTDSTPQCLTVESTDVSEIDISSSKTDCDGEAPSDDVDAVTTDGDIQMDCEFESSPEKSVRFADSAVSENKPITFNLNSSPLQQVQSHRERSVSVSSTDRDISLDKRSEIFELTDDDEEEENLGGRDHRERSNKFDQSNEFDDDIESDTFDNSSEEDTQSMSDDEPMDDDYDSEERIHSIDDSDDDQISVSQDVRRINSSSLLHYNYNLIFILIFIFNNSNNSNTGNASTYYVGKVKQRST